MSSHMVSYFIHKVNMLYKLFLCFLFSLFNYILDFFFPHQSIPSFLCFFIPHSIPLHGCTVIHVTSSLLVDIWVASSLLLLQKNAAMAFNQLHLLINTICRIHGNNYLPSHLLLILTPACFPRVPPPTHFLSPGFRSAQTLACISISWRASSNLDSWTSLFLESFWFSRSWLRPKNLLL